MTEQLPKRVRVNLTGLVISLVLLVIVLAIEYTPQFLYVSRTVFAFAALITVSWCIVTAYDKIKSRKLDRLASMEIHPSNGDKYINLIGDSK